MVSIYSSRVVDREFDPWLGKTKDYKIWYLLLLAKHAALRSKILVGSESGYCVEFR